MIASYVFICLQLIFALYLVYYIVAFLSGAPFVPTINKTADSMIDLVTLKTGMRAYDLGSGEGKLLKRIAQTGATAIGIEINPLLCLYTTIRFALFPQKGHVEVWWKNFWHVPLSDADVLFVYLLPLRMNRLEKKIKEDCKKGTLVVSNSFMFQNLKLLKKDALHHVYIYTV